MGTESQEGLILKYISSVDETAGSADLTLIGVTVYVLILCDTKNWN